MRAKASRQSENGRFSAGFACGMTVRDARFACAACWTVRALSTGDGVKHRRSRVACRPRPDRPRRRVSPPAHGAPRRLQKPTFY